MSSKKRRVRTRSQLPRPGSESQPGAIVTAQSRGGDARGALRKKGKEVGVFDQQIERCEDASKDGAGRGPGRRVESV